MARILIIDDDPLVRKIVSERLSLFHTVFTAPDWTQANEYIFRNPVDLIFMDVEMPGVNGDKIAKVLKDTSFLKIKAPKIVFFSSLDEDLLREKVLESGIEGYIAKTFHTDTLLEKVREFLGETMNAKTAIA